jgi:hypothetical protein
MHRQLTCLSQGDSSSLVARESDVVDIYSDSMDNGQKNLFGAHSGMSSSYQLRINLQYWHLAIFADFSSSFTMRGLCFALELALPNGGVGVLNPASELEAVMQSIKA